MPPNETGRQPGRALFNPDAAGSPVTVTESTTTAVARFVPSLAAIVYVVVGETPVGVPEMTPVEELNDNPAGRDGEIAKVRVAPNVVDASAAVGESTVPTRPTTV